MDKLNIEDFRGELDEIKSVLNIMSVNEPPKREGGIILDSVDELIDKLKNVDKVL